MCWYHRIIFSLGQLPSFNTPKGTLKSNFCAEYKSVSFDLANDAQNRIFKTLPLPSGQATGSSESCSGDESCVSTRSNISCNICFSTFPGTFCLVLKKTKVFMKKCSETFPICTSWRQQAEVTWPQSWRKATVKPLQGPVSPTQDRLIFSTAHSPAQR